ncbi:alpha-1,6-mannosyltransferase [Saccharomycopsis crataegensis]|uniref:Alpha-1,6-mannosyltransferase n=1 Tax=Saccharomycopsis crataegensis TaxID=43959 RepID=A0AAV5QX60_9ASCO|nr:alpha-1,6-mannosyltransferase [Saccharomycopsis crataegensis]
MVIFHSETREYKQLFDSIPSSQLNSRPPTSRTMDHEKDIQIIPPYAALQPRKKQRSPFASVKMMLSSFKKTLMLLTCVLMFFVYLKFPTGRFKQLQQRILNKDPEIVIILAANEGGGVLKWKGAQEWSVERSSINNKKYYANKHGYGLTIKDMTIKRRYSHEWRESWEKVDILKQTMRQFPNTKWFWWLDLHTYIIEPQLSLEEHIFNNLNNLTYRITNEKDFNPLNLDLNIPYADYKNSPVEMLITQDCGGFNLGSFLIKKSPWSELLLDIWWDPAFYEQMHMIWEHKEQDAFETLYRTQPWIRERIGFLPLKSINAFPPGACSDKADDPQFFYNENDRDFVVNMAGCEWGRDCWAEMEYYKSVDRRLHKKPWYKFW